LHCSKSSHGGLGTSGALNQLIVYLSFWIRASSS
jgi:hypothetical protein